MDESFQVTRAASGFLADGDGIRTLLEEHTETLSDHNLHVGDAKYGGHNALGITLWGLKLGHSIGSERTADQVAPGMLEWIWKMLTAGFPMVFVCALGYTNNQPKLARRHKLYRPRLMRHL